MKKAKLCDYFYDIENNQEHKNISCDVLINKQKRKLYGKKKNKIYLNNGDYIQINLANYNTYRIGVQLELNGNIESNILVLNPGEKILLDRFIDNNSKIKYDTYFIDGNDIRSKNAVSKNGKLKIHFWNETITTIYHGDCYNTTGVNSTPSTLLYSQSDISGLSGPIGPTGPTGTLGHTVTGINGTVDIVSSNNIVTDISTNNVFYNTTTTNSNSRIYESNVFNDQLKSKLSNKSPKLEETGRISKGEKSKQKTTTVSFTPSDIFHVESFKLIPFSKMKKKSQKLNFNNNLRTTTVDNLTKNKNTDHRTYCDNPLCGYRVRNRNWKFCPICSNEIK